MKNEKDLRVIKTKALILDTFKAMICEMDANKITVKELTERARIHRQTFYLHYPALDALFEEVLRNMVDKQEIMWASFAPSLSPREANRCFFSQMFNNEKYEERILCHHSYAEYCDRYFELGSSAIFSYARDFLPFHREQRNMIISFVNHSLMFFYRGWVNSGKKMSLDELLDLSETLLSGVQAYIAK